MAETESTIQENTSVQYLQKALDETQETIRAYDTKAEVLAIVLTLVVGVINFSALTDKCKASQCLDYLRAIPLLLGFITLVLIGMVLFPRRNLFKEIDSGTDRPKGTYFVSLQFMPAFKNLDEYLRQVDATDWKRELAYEVLKTSCIRDHKHFWFHWALRGATFTLAAIVILVVGGVVHG